MSHAVSLWIYCLCHAVGSSASSRGVGVVRRILPERTAETVLFANRAWEVRQPIADGVGEAIQSLDRTAGNPYAVKRRRLNRNVVGS
jgi:hypothetical protein